MKKLKIKNIFDGRVYIYLCRFAFAVFALVVVSQIGLKNEPTRDVFTKIESYEGIEVSGDGAIIKGTVEFSVTSGEPSEAYHILVNGEKVDVLDSFTKELDLYAPSVVEIYPAQKGKKLKVKMLAKSDNLRLLMDETDIVIEDGIEIINKIIFK